MLSAFSQFIFGDSTRFGGQNNAIKQSNWKDKNLCFDLRCADLELDCGEQLIGSFFAIEDAKGNQDEPGLLKVTNLRLIWMSSRKKRVNLSIGWRTVTLAFEQNLKDSLGETSTSLCILTKYGSTKYEFVFNKMLEAYEDWNYEDGPDSFSKLERLLRTKRSLMTTHLSPMYLDDPFDVVLKVWQAYKQTYLFRQCRANLSNLFEVTFQGQPPLSIDDYSKLPSEETIDIYSDVVQTESRLIKCLGSLILTNIRMIWIDSTLPVRNLSIPYIKIESLKIKNSDKLIIRTEDYLATSNQIELRMVRPPQQEAKKSMFEQVQKLYTLYKANPKFGPESCDECIDIKSHLKTLNFFFNGKNNHVPDNFGPEVKREPANEMSLIQTGEGLLNSTARQVGDNEFLLENEEYELRKYGSNLRSYLEELPLSNDKEVIYSEDLGLAIERPKNNADLRRVWNIVL